MIIKVVFCGILVVVLFVAANIFVLDRYVKTIKPPERFVLAEMDAAVFKISHQNETHFAVIPLKWRDSVWSRLALLSGCPVYIYDNNGDLVDWAYDSGDNSAFLKKWATLFKL